jgi:hypothetical protein
MKILSKIFFKLFKRGTPNPTVRHDLEEIEIEKNLKLLVYWKALTIGKGPAVILQAFENEILKFDCFGKNKGHYHIAPHYDFRIFFIEETVPDQISRTIKELRLNGFRYLKSQNDSRFKSLILDESKYQETLDQVEKKLFQFHLTIPELKE